MPASAAVEPRDHGLAKAQDFVVRIEDQRDDMGAPGLEPQRRAIAHIADLGGDLLHAHARLVGELGRVVEGA